jgi:hypothetical protein
LSKKETPIVGVTGSAGTCDDSDFQQQKSKMEKDLELLKIRVKDKRKRALHGEALFKEVEIFFETVSLELERVIAKARELNMEEDNICSQLHTMKKGDGMFFSPKPIVHLEKPADDGERNFIIIKSCGYCNQWYHCYDVVYSYKHTFHPWCLGAMLKDKQI